MDEKVLDEGLTHQSWIRVEALEKVH